MPVTYSVVGGGHFILAVASPPLTEDEFVDFEIDHAADDRVQEPLAEMLLIESGACNDITPKAVQQILDRRRKITRDPTPHRCAIVVPYSDGRAWDLARFYQGMATLHRHESVIVFGDEKLARVWLEVDEVAAP